MCGDKANSSVKQLRRSYGFDEVAIVPGDLTINPDQTSTDFQIGDITFSIPIVTSAMDGVVDVETARIAADDLPETRRRLLVILLKQVRLGQGELDLLGDLGRELQFQK